MADARQRKFDCVLVWKLDRFGRSLVDCLTNIRALESYGVRFIVVTQGLDAGQCNPASRFLPGPRGLGRVRAQLDRGAQPRQPLNDKT